MKRLESYKDRKQLFNENVRRAYQRGALETYEQEIIELEKGSEKTREELHIVLTVVTKYLERADHRSDGKTLKLSQSASILVKYKYIYERGILNLVTGNEFGVKRCRLCENEDSD